MCMHIAGGSAFIQLYFNAQEAQRLDSSSSARSHHTNQNPCNGGTFAHEHTYTQRGECDVIRGNCVLYSVTKSISGIFQDIFGQCVWWGSLTDDLIRNGKCYSTFFSCACCVLCDVASTDVSATLHSTVLECTNHIWFGCCSVLFGLSLFFSGALSPHPQEDCVIYCAEIINYFVCLFAECTTMCLGVTKDTVCRFKMLRLYDLWTIERYFTILWTSICFRAGRRKLWPQVQIVTHVIRQS